MELGGKNPTIIFDDCDLENSINTTVRSSFLNQGEICLCGSRIYVQSGIYQTWLKAFVTKVSSMKVGDPKSPTTDCGALISLMHLKKVKYYIQKAIDEGSKIEVGGLELPQNLSPENQNGYFIAPTVITSVAENSCLIQDEIFGPVVTVMPFENEDQAISLANNVQYGLASSIWTSNSSRVHRIAHAIDAGTVWVNTWMLRDLRVPFGGMKASGVGREGGNNSIDVYTEQKTVVIRHDMK